MTFPPTASHVQSGAKARLLSLLVMLLQWAVAYNVPVDCLAWQTAVDAVEGRRQQTVFFVGHTITGFFDGLRAPVLVMFGEEYMVSQLALLNA